MPRSVAEPLLEAGVDPLESVGDAGVADSESFDFAEPAFAFGFDDAGIEVVADLFQSGALGWVRP
jgi:hypothetical protein